MASNPKSEKVSFDDPCSAYVKVTMSDVIKVLMMINDYAQLKKLSRRVNSTDHLVEIPAKTVIAVKAVVAAHSEMSQSTLGKRVLFRKKAKRRIENDVVDVLPTSGSVATGNHEHCGFGSGR